MSKRYNDSKYKKHRFYFTQEVEDAIIEYNNCDDKEKRDKIFKDIIYRPFMKIAENLIHRYKFYYFDIPLEDVKRDVVSFLTKKIGKYTKDKGKAFSYFSVVAKNWLIINNNKNYDYLKKHKYFSEFSDEEYEYRMEEVMLANKKNISDERRERLRDILFELADYIEENMEFLFNKERDKNIAYAICNILKRYDKINSYYKKYLYILIREYADEETYHITKVLKVFKKQKDKIVNRKTEKYLNVDDDTKELYNI